MTDLPGTRAAFCDLVALRAVADLDLATYVAGDPGRARHVMGLTRAGGQVVYRTLHRGEPLAWASGLAAGAGLVDLGDQLAATAVPALLDGDTAARALGLSVQGLHYAVRAGDLYPLYGNRAGTGTGTARYLFASQVAAEAARRQLRGDHLAAGRRKRLEAQLDQSTQAWLQVRQMLPAPVRESMVDVDIRPLPSPDPLPVDPDAAPAVQAVRGLQIAEAQGWLTYHYPIGRAYAVTMVDQRGHEVDMTVPADGVLAWLLGVADRHGRADLVAYRPGLGG